MKNRIHILIVILIINCLGQALYAAGLIQELSTFSTKLTNLTKKLAQEGPGRPLPPTPPPPTPVTKPKEPSEKPPEFIKNKQFRFQYGQDSAGSLKQIIVGLVDDGTSSNPNLVVYGPKLTNVTPEDFIVQIETKIPGQILPKKENRLSFPINKAKDITWSSSRDPKIIDEKPLANFVLVKGSDYEELKKQETEAQGASSKMLSKIDSSMREISVLPPATPFLKADDARTWLKRIQTATNVCGEVRDQNLFNIFNKKIDILNENTQKVIAAVKGKIGKNLAAAKGSEIQEFTAIMNDISVEQEKLNKCLSDIAVLQKKPSLENMLYQFYIKYLGDLIKPSQIPDWWVVTERKIKEPIIPEKPGKTTEPTGSTENLKGIEYKLELEYEAYKNLPEKDRPDFMLTKTEYKDPETGAFFTLKELLSYYIKKAEDRMPKLVSWNRYIIGENYTSYWLKSPI